MLAVLSALESHPGATLDYEVAFGASVAAAQRSFRQQRPSRLTDREQYFRTVRSIPARSVGRDDNRYIPANRVRSFGGESWLGRGG